jgi:hypothetical protein
MKQKRFKMSALLLFCLGLTSIQAQTMYLHKNIGTQDEYYLSNVRKMSFSEGNLIVSSKNGQEDKHSLTEIKYLNFNNLITEFHELLPSENAELQLYPNPVKDVLNLKNTTENKEGISIIIHSTDGKTVYFKALDNKADNFQINVSGLPKGIYLLRISNGKAVKSSKFIKL